MIALLIVVLIPTVMVKFVMAWSFMGHSFLGIGDSLPRGSAVYCPRGLVWWS